VKAFVFIGGALDVKQIKQMETALADARDKAKTELLGQVNAKLVELADIGFKYELVENGTAKKLGRPRKESNGVQEKTQTAAKG